MYHHGFMYASPPPSPERKAAIILTMVSLLFIWRKRS